jgi:hypothetical protein
MKNASGRVISVTPSSRDYELGWVALLGIAVFAYCLTFWQL